MPDTYLMAERGSSGMSSVARRTFAVSGTLWTPSSKQEEAEKINIIHHYRRRTT